MKYKSTMAAIFVAAALPQVALAQDATSEQAAAAIQVERGKPIYTAEGKRLGRVERIYDRDGVPQAAGIIYQMKMIYIPLSTLSAAEKGYQTTMTLDEIRNLR